MSNPYPPTPSFGGAYVGYPFTTTATTTASRDGGYQTLSGGPPAHQQREMYSAATPVNNHHPHPHPDHHHHHLLPANKQSFQAKATISNIGHAAAAASAAPPPPLPPPPFQVSPDFFKQFANSTLPPPPYPPVPIPHLGFTQLQPPPPNFVATSTPPNNSVNNNSLPHQNSQPHFPGPHAVPEYMQDSYIASKEEGELSDGELDTSSPDSMVDSSRPGRTNQTASLVEPREVAVFKKKGHSPAQPITFAAGIIPTDFRSSALEQTSSASRVAFSTAETMGNVFQRHSEIQQPQVPAPDNESVSSYNPPSASTPDPAEPNGDMADTPPSGFQLAKPPMPTKVVQPGSATLFLREQVKDALRSLGSHNIKYEELVGEGVDPHLLRKLYEELKKESIQRNLSFSDLDAQRISAAQKPGQRDPQQPNDVSGPSSGDSGQNMQGPETAGTTSILTSNHPISKNIEGEGLLDPSHAPAPVEVRTQKPPVVPALSNTAIERKDRIAQLLAAKTGRAVAPRLPAEIPPQLPTKSPKPETPAEAPEKPLSLPEKPPAPSSEQSVKVKNKAQTELIRQKMEALKKEALAKAQVQDAAKAVSVVSSPAAELPSNVAHAQQPAATAEIGSTEIGFQIPGLFMTNETRSNAPDTKNMEKDDSPIEMLNDPISISSTSDSISQRTSAERDNDSVRPPGGQVLPMRLPQKRPLASDSFDEQMPALKRPFGRKDSHGKVEIVLSEAESEGEVEDVEMELDEESDEEQPTNRDEPPPVSLPQSNIRNLPALTDFPSPRPVALLASGIATPTSSAIQTPGREKEKEELWKAKNQEIEQMRKKIAEMEERRKAKQSATHTISPKAAGKPAMPAIRTSLTRPSNSESPGLAKSHINVKAPASASSGIPISPMLPASRPEELPSTPSTPLHAIKEPLKAEDLRQKLLRRKTTREGTPNTAEMEIRQAQLAEKKAKLAELRREAEKREAEILEETRMLEAQLQAGLDEHESYEDGLSTENGYLEEDSNAMEPKPKDASLATDVDAQDGAIEESSGPVQSFSPMRTQGSPLETYPDRSPSRADTVPRSSAEEGIIDERSGMVRTMSSMATVLDAKSQAPQDLAVRPGVQDVETAIMPPSDHTSSMSIHETGRVDDVNSPPSFYEDELANDASQNNFEADFIDEDGSVSMSDSVSEDYEPAEPEQMEDDQAEDDSEPYEPAEVPVRVNEVQQPTSLHHKLDEPITVDTPILEAPVQPTSPLNNQSNQPIYIDDSEDGMQLTEPDVINKPQVISQSHDDENSDNVRQPVSYFTPYETPRKYFKNFRYHDHFPETVASGYKSLTFSNSIEPRKPFCPTELAGQECQDPTCEEQHFREVALTDDKILAQMSTANNLKTKAEHERWVAGLRQVIAELRSKGVKDFHMVASALAAYRRRFSEELSTSTSASSQS